jgi:type I restriction enzyme S subunit
LKPQWEKKRLGDWAAAVSTGPFGSVLHKSDYVDDGVPLVNPINIVGERIVPDPTKLIGEATRRRLAGYVLQDGDIVVGRRGEIGRCAVVGTREAGWVCGTGSFFIRPSRAMDPHFLAHLIRSSEYRERLERSATGTTMKNLSNTALADLEVPLPPLPEQQRIVAILDEAFDGIATAKANAEKNLQNARALFDSHMNGVFESGSRRWPQKLLGDLCEILDSRRVPITKRDRTPGDVPYYGATGIQDHVHGFIFDEPLVLLGEDGAKWGAGERTAFAISGKSWVNNHAHVLRPNRRFLIDDWLIYYLNSSDLSPFIAGLTVPKLTQGSMRDIPIPCPSIAEQMRLVEVSRSIELEVERLESFHSRKLTALEALEKSLLHQAFSGHL